MQYLHLIKFQADLGKELGIAISLEGWENGPGTVASPVRIRLMAVVRPLYSKITGNICRRDWKIEEKFHSLVTKSEEDFKYNERALSSLSAFILKLKNLNYKYLIKFLS